MELLGILVKLEPLFMTVFGRPEVQAYRSSTVLLWNPSAEVDQQVGSVKDVVIVPGL